MVVVNAVEPGQQCEADLGVLSVKISKLAVRRAQGDRVGRTLAGRAPLMSDSVVRASRKTPCHQRKRPGRQ
ncbi:hypothetical protein T261_0089 [Streptomyces lydicus]|nr:hypothetical protein T261_0089 [Streptomyces lydicus]